jgi:hypothetical protein
MFTVSSYIGLIIVSLSLSCVPEAEPQEFPAVIEAIEDMKVSVPLGTTEDPYPEEYNLLSGDEGDYAWVHLRGYINIDMVRAWEAIRDPLVFINHRTVTEYTVTDLDVNEYDYRFQVYNFVEDIVDVEFDTEWRHAALEGTKETPSRVGVRWQKVSGTEFIASLDGSVQILPVSDGRKDVVEVQIIEHLSATLNQESEAIQYVEDVYERWKLVAQGEDIPSYQE